MIGQGCDDRSGMYGVIHDYKCIYTFIYSAALQRNFSILVNEYEICNMTSN